MNPYVDFGLDDAKMHFWNVRSVTAHILSVFDTGRAAACLHASGMDTNMTCTCFAGCSSAFVPEARSCTRLCTMEPSPWQLLAARLMATGGGAASSSSQTAAPAMGFGYPGSGSQTAAEAAQAYALYTQLAEQARLAAMAETQMLQQAASSQDDVKEAVRQLVKQEMQAARSENQTVDKEKKPANEDNDGSTAPEKKNDADRAPEKKTDAERAGATAASDKRTIQYARDVYLKEQKAAEEAQKSSKKSGPPPPSSRPNLRCVGGYKVQGGYIEVWSRFRPFDKKSDVAQETTADEVTEQPEDARDARASSEKEVRKAKDHRKDSTATKDDRKDKTAKLRPREPEYPPGCEGINPPPPPVDWKNEGKRILDCTNPCVSLLSHVLNYFLQCCLDLRKSSRQADKEDRGGYKRPKGGRDKDWRWY